MGTWLAWTSRARSFQGIPEISYSWVTASAVGRRLAASHHHGPQDRRRAAEASAAARPRHWTSSDALGPGRLHGAAADGHAGRLRHRHLRLRVLPAAPGAAVDHPDPARHHRDAELRAARDPAVHPGRQRDEQLRHHAQPAAPRHRAHRAPAGRPGADLDRALHADERRHRLEHRRRGDEYAPARLRDAEARLLQGLRRRRAVVRLAAGADHPAGHRLHPLRHRRPGVDRAPVRRRHHPRADALGGARAHHLGHRAGGAAMQPELKKRPTREGDRARRRGAASGRSCSRSSCCSACASASSRPRRSAPSRWCTRW